mmetsp:Transcript_20888/g.48276  ORF Transcript_20888/g.48276 Transcript_20888/m.48276 type:complete len:713 (+) Transcript_20888:95-2233(+)
MQRVKSGGTESTRPVTGATSGYEDDDEDEGEEPRIPEHLAYILDGLAQEDDDVELDQAGLSLTGAIGKGQPVKETDVEMLFELVPELLGILVGRALSKDNRLFHGRGNMSSNMWCCLHIAQSIVDIRHTYPNLGETHFHHIFDTLEKLLVREDLLLESSRELPMVVISLLNLFSPKIATRLDHFDRAIPIIAKYLDKAHSGIKACCSSILESCHQYAPRTLLKSTESMVNSMKEGKVVVVPALAHLYEIQPEAQRMFEPHIEWLFDIYEGRYAGVKDYSEKEVKAQRPAMAALLKNMANNNPVVLENYVPRMIPGLQDPTTCKDIAEALLAMAKHNPAPQIGIIDDVKEALRKLPERVSELAALLAVLGANDRVTAIDLADFFMRLVENVQEALLEEKATLQDMQARGTLTKDLKKTMEAKIERLKRELPIGLMNLRVVAEKQTRAIAPLVNRLHPYLAHEMPEVRENVFFLTLQGSSNKATGVIRCDREGSQGSSSHIDREAVFATVWCRKHTPWEFFYEVQKAVRNINVPLVMMQVRFDGKIGFFGGNVEEGETVEDTLARELREELNVSNASPEAGYEYLCSHEVAQTRTRTHFYAKEVSNEEFLKHEIAAREAQHFGAEVLGVFRAPLYVNTDDEDETKTPGEGLPNFLKGSLHSGVVEELLWLIASKELIPREQIEVSASALGLSLDIVLPPDGHAGRPTSGKSARS